MINRTARLMAAAFGMATLPVTSSAFDAEIRWTQYGVPHIKAADYAGLGYGYGYATAGDHLCTLAERVWTLRGERSRLMGPNGAATVGFAPASNLDSDLFYRVQLSEEEVGTAWRALSADARNLAGGYAAGFNRYVRDLGPADRSGKCAGMPLPAMEPADVARSAMHIGVIWKATDVASSAAVSLWENLTAPGESHASSLPGPQQAADVPVAEPASNAWAYGSDVTSTGAAIVVANPHSMWQPHWLLMHQLHLTIPGEIDVMGADFLGLPVPLVGYTRHVAWSIEAPSTVNYHLLLSLPVTTGPTPTYRFEGRTRKLIFRAVQLDIRLEDGSIQRRTFRVPYSHLGALYRLGARPGRPAGWYAITDATAGNARVAACFVAGADRQAGKPSVAPRNVLDGTRRACTARTFTGAAKLAPPQHIPVLATRGIVHNANDSYRFAIFGKQLTGYSLLLGDPLAPALGARTLMSQRHIAEALGDGPITLQDATDVLFSNRNYAAETTLDGVLSACTTAVRDSAASSACSMLAGWDRRNDSRSRGALLFHVAWPRLRDVPGLYVQPFDATHPFRVRSISRAPTVAANIVKALEESMKALDQVGLRGDEPWGSILGRPGPHGREPLHGGDSDQGVLNTLSGRPLQAGGFAQIVNGSSYIQVVTWERDRPVARVMLAHGQSDDPRSPHYSDQIPLFQRKELQAPPFTDEEIEADPGFTATHLHE